MQSGFIFIHILEISSIYICECRSYKTRPFIICKPYNILLLLMLQISALAILYISVSFFFIILVFKLVFVFFGSMGALNVSCCAFFPY